MIVGNIMNLKLIKDPKLDEILEDIPPTNENINEFLMVKGYNEIKSLPTHTSQLAENPDKFSDHKWNRIGG